VISAGLVGMYALYFVFVGMRGNAPALMEDVSQDVKGFIPWIIAILVLRGLYGSDTLRPLIKPFIALAVLTFVLKNWATVASQVNPYLPANAQLKP
jgi:hypothetical protein